MQENQLSRHDGSKLSKHIYIVVVYFALQKQIILWSYLTIRRFI
jgi:hypothetical protein